MKQVYFDKLDSPGNRILGFSSVIFITIYLYTSFNYEGSTLHLVSAVLGFGFFVIFLGKQFYFRNYMGWNKKGMVLKLNSFFSKSIPFNQIDSFNIKNDHLEIIRLNRSINTFKLTDIREDQIDRILEILKAKTKDKNEH